MRAFFFGLLIAAAGAFCEDQRLPPFELAYAEPKPHSHSHDDHGHAHGHAHDGHGLHFSHPILTEVPTPHNVVSFRYAHDRLRDEGNANQDTFELGVEYSPVRWFSFELGVPYAMLNPDRGPYEDNLDSMEFAFKFASFAFEERGIVVTAGLEMGLPTGDDAKGIGSNNEVELEPFVTMGYKLDKFELIPLVKVGLPVKRNDGEDLEPELGYQVSALYHFHSRVAALLEVVGATNLKGEERGRTVIDVSPGLKFRPFDQPSIEFGVNATLPVTSQKDRHWGVGFGMFLHF
jgi:hypothetical protein